MLLKYTNYLSKKNIINFLIMFIPLSYIAGNLILNLTVVLLISFVLFAYGKNILDMRFNYSDKLIILFFIYILINGVYNNFFEINESNISQNNFALSKQNNEASTYCKKIIKQDSLVNFEMSSNEIYNKYINI